MRKDMDSKFEHFKNTLQEEPNELPQDYAWEEMKPAIFSKMEAPSKPKRRWLLLFFVLFGSLALLTYIGVETLKKAPVLASTAPPLPAKKLEDNAATPALSSPPLAATSPSPTKETQKASTELGYKQPASSFPANAPSENQLTTPGIASTPKAEVLPTAWASEKNSLQASDYSSARQPLEALSPLPLATRYPLVSTASNDRLLERQVLGYSNSIAPLATLTPTYLTLDTLSGFTLIPANVQVPKTKKQWRLGLLVGTNIASEQAFELDNPNVSAKEESLYSPTAQLNLEIPLAANIYTQAGLRWQQSNSFLQYTSATPTSVLATDVVLLRSINISSNDTTEMRGDTLLTATENRRLGQFNQRTIWQIPIAIGYRKSFGKWELGLQLGATAQLSLQQSGLNPQHDGNLLSLQSFQEQQQPANFRIHWATALRLQYQVSEDWSLGWQASLTKVNQNWRSAELTNYRPILHEQAFVLYWHF